MRTPKKAVQGVKTSKTAARGVNTGKNSLKKVNEKSKVPTKAQKPTNNKGKKKAKSDSLLNSSINDEAKIKIPVDAECSEKLGKAHVYSEDADVYNAMLNQTNLQFNNNKFYLLQLLKDNDSDTYSVWFRWGRVGKAGQTSLQHFSSNLQSAKDCFVKKFQEKTKNKWEERKKFCKVEGKYDLVSIEYDTDKVEALAVAETSKKSSKKVKIPESKLKRQLQDLIKLIFDVDIMETTVAEMKYDAKKAPLGNLTTEQIKAGYLALKKVEKHILENKTGADFVKACNEFYTRIPHDFGMKRPPLIQTVLELKEKIELLEVLGGIEIAMQMMTADSLENVHPVDYQYENLCCELEPLEESHPEYKVIEQYLKNTHGDTHGHYSLSITNIFRCHKATEEENFCDYGNNTLLWHGSRLSNWAGILKTGLRIAPPEAPVTGHMFGKGIYFADMVSKSANYCHATDEGLLLLCKVSLGNQNEKRHADYKANKLPKGYNSVFAKGRVYPNPEEAVFLSDGTKVPLGKPLDEKAGDYSLFYNEYIVYNRNQVQMRYVLRVKFDYKVNWF